MRLLKGCARGEGRGVGLAVHTDHQGAGILGPVFLAEGLGPKPPEGAELGRLFEELGARVDEPSDAGKKIVYVKPPADHFVCHGHSESDAEPDLLRRRASRLADVAHVEVASVEEGDVAGAVLDDVEALLLRPQAIGHASSQLMRLDALQLGDGHVVGQGEGGAGDEVDGNLPQVDALEEGLIVVEAIGNDAILAGEALHSFVVGVRPRAIQPHHGEGVGPLREEELPPLVGLLGRADPGHLSDVQAPGAEPSGKDTARIGTLAGEGDIIEEIGSRYVGRGIERFHRQARHGDVLPLGFGNTGQNPIYLFFVSSPRLFELVYYLFLKHKSLQHLLVVLQLYVSRLDSRLPPYGLYSLISGPLAPSRCQMIGRNSRGTRPSCRNLG